MEGGAAVTETTLDAVDEDEELFYVQDARRYVGDCVLWWGKERSGYTTELGDAGLYTADEVARMTRETDVPWPRRVVERAAARTAHVRADYLRAEAGDDARSGRDENERKKK